jgi:hypothetical protein
MCLHVTELPCARVGKVAQNISTLNDIEVQAYAQLQLHVHAHNGARCGSSTTMLEYHLGRDG